MRAEALYTLSAVMECDRVARGDWGVPVWRLIGFMPAPPSTDSAQRQRVHAEADREQWLWSGLTLALFRGSAEAYWYNLVGRRPSLFLVCREDRGGELAPFMVTADYDEAGAHMEADDQVFAAPIPPPLHRTLEAFVMRHYHPRPPHKRRRADWTERNDDGCKPSPRLARQR